MSAPPPRACSVPTWKPTSPPSVLCRTLRPARDPKSISFIASKHGGVDIEQVAKDTPEDIHTIVVDFVEGLQPYQCRDLGLRMDLNPKQVTQLVKIILGLYKLFNTKDR